MMIWFSSSLSDSKTDSLSWVMCQFFKDLWGFKKSLLDNNGFLVFIIQWIIIKFCDPPLSLFLSIYIYLYLYLGLNNLFSPQMSDSVHGNIMGKRERPNFFLSPSPFYSIDTHTNRCGENKCSAFMTIRVSGAYSVY